MNPMMCIRSTSAATSIAILAFAGLNLVSVAPASAAVSVNGQVLEGGARLPTRR
jgi:hypothetical protein